MSATVEWMFWVSVGLVFYAYGGYPFVLIVLASLKQVTSDLRFALSRRTRRVRRARSGLPRVSLVFAAHNEAAVIQRKLRNCAQLDYPIAALEILVGCDGCTDGTAALARAVGLPNASIFEFPDRTGKPGVLNRVVPHARGDILAFCDANTELEPCAIRTLIRHFDEPQIGCVCGELRLRSRGQASGEHMYWRFETLLKFLESRLNMLVGANGALFAIRRSLFVPLPADGIVDDFLIAMNVRAAGYRVIYDPEAIAWEEVAATARHEFRRHVRIGAGNFHALRHTWRMLSPTVGVVALAFWSHKVCRWLVPVLLVAAFVSAAMLGSNPLYGAATAAGALLILLALMGHCLDRRKRSWAPATIPYHFFAMNLALLLGLIAFIRKSQSSIWAPTSRAATASVEPAAETSS